MKRTAVLTTLLSIALGAIGLTAVSMASATVLCKTATDPCTGGTYGKGTAIEASLKAGTQSVLDTSFGQVKCSESTIKGEVTNPGGETGNVAGAVSSLSFGKCTATVTVLKPGTFTIKSSSGGDGTLVLEGLETTVSYLGFHCIYSGPTSISMKGGEMASIGNTATLPHTGGGAGAFCGESAQWTVDYTVTAPEPLWVAET